MAEISKRDMQRLRNMFSKSLGDDFGEKVPDISVDGGDLEVILLPSTFEVGILIPYNESGEQVLLKVDNSTLKRWRAECMEAKTLMRRVASGERNTSHKDRHTDGARGIRGCI